MDGPTSAAVLAALLAGGHALAGVVLAAGRFARASRPEPIVALPPPPLALHTAGAPASCAQLAWGRGIPLFELRRAGDPHTLAELAALRPDVVCVACFPLRLPPTLLALPPHGCLNMHPSLLPQHRGPEPLFWALRSGAPVTGVTIHHMDEGFDTGAIALQAPITLPDGIGGPEAERRCAALGGVLMAAAVQALAANALPRHPQPAGGSYEGFPQSADWRIDAGWPARRAFNFMRGTAAWGRPYPLAIGASELLLASASGYDAAAVLAAPLVRAGDQVAVQMRPGVLHAQLGNTAIT